MRAAGYAQHDAIGQIVRRLAEQGLRQLGLLAGVVVLDGELSAIR